MQALITTPGRPDAVRVDEVAEPTAAGGAIAVRTLEVGVCGTDREIAAGEFGTPPPGETELVLGHEFLGMVVEDGGGFSAGDLVTATVRRSCGRCAACDAGSPDACDTGEYTERGITALHGFAGEIVAEHPEHIVAIPPSLGRLGVLAEPGSICARGIRHATTIGARQVWTPRRALVIGAGAIGMLATYQLRLVGLAVWTAARGAAGSEKGRLVTESGAEYVSTAESSLTDVRDAVGGFDLVIEASGNAEIMLGVLGLLRRNGVGCLLGLDAHRRPLTVDSGVFGVETVIENRVLLGSVNAHATDWRSAVDQLAAIHARWPDALEAMVGLRVSPDRFAEAFAFRGVKATLRFDR
jgi:threonine dehydrogenase-like Zn-dependent dehydrogenase